MTCDVGQKCIGHFLKLVSQGSSIDAMVVGDLFPTFFLLGSVGRDTVKAKGCICRRGFDTIVTSDVTPKWLNSTIDLQDSMQILLPKIGFCDEFLYFLGRLSLFQDCSSTRRVHFICHGCLLWCVLVRETQRKFW